MENSEPQPASHPDEPLQFWAHVEARNGSQSEDLIQKYATAKRTPLWSVIALGLAFYLTIAIGFVALCLCCNSPKLRGTDGDTAGSRIRHAEVFRLHAVAPLSRTLACKCPIAEIEC